MRFTLCALAFSLVAAVGAAAQTKEEIKPVWPAVPWSATPFNSSTPTPSPQQVDGVGALSLATPRKFAETPEPRAYYAALEVRSAFDQRFKDLKGAAARGLLDQLTALFGSTARGFTVALDVTMDGVALPTIYPFSASFKNEDGGYWETSLDKTVITPFIVLTGSTRFEYQFKFAGTSKTDVVALSKTLDIVQGASTALAVVAPGAWALNAAALPVIKTAAAEVDKTASSLFFKNIQISKVKETVIPAGSGWAGNTYTMQGFKFDNIGSVAIDVVLRSSLVSEATMSATTAKPSAPPKFGVYASLLREQVKYYQLDLAKIDTELRANQQSSILKDIQNPASPNDFAAACNRLRTFLGNAGLNRYDVYGYAWEVLQSEGRDTVSKPEFLNSGCFELERDQFEAIGRPLTSNTMTCSPGYIVSKQFMDAVALHWLDGNQQALHSVMPCLAPSLVITDLRGNPVDDGYLDQSETAANLMKKLRTMMPMEGKTSYGCYTPAIGTVWRNSLTVQYTGKKRAIIEFSTHKDDPSGKVVRVKIRDMNATENCASMPTIA